MTSLLPILAATALVLVLPGVAGERSSVEWLAEAVLLPSPKGHTAPFTNIEKKYNDHKMKGAAPALKQCSHFDLPTLDPIGNGYDLWRMQRQRDTDLADKTIDEIFLKSRRWPGIHIDVASLYRFARGVISPYSDEWSTFPVGQSSNHPPYAYYRGGRMYEGSDPIILHSVIRAFKPSRVLEVGSGFSTRVSAAALLLNERDCNASGTLVALEPNSVRVPKPLPGLTALRENYLESEILEPFLELEANDVLVVDSSHRIQAPFTGDRKRPRGRKWEDVPILYTEVLPRLQPGVIIHGMVLKLSAQRTYNPNLLRIIKGFMMALRVVGVPIFFITHTQIAVHVDHA